MKRVLTVMAVTALLLSACKSSGDPSTAATSPNDGGPTSSSTTATSAPSSEPGTGVTDDEILVGVVYTDLEAIREVVKIDHGDYFTAFEALADDINARGGINGRKIKLVDGAVIPIGTESATTVCTAMTEDQQVFAVLGNVQADVTPCFVTTHDTALVGGQQTAERLAAARAPWFAFDAGLDYSALKTIEGAADAGEFDGKRVAVVSLPAHQDLLSTSIDPLLEEADVDVVSRAVIDAPPDDQSAARIQAQSIAERFSADGADIVIALGDTFLSFVRGLEFTSYRPGIVATDANVFDAYMATNPDYTVLPGLVTGGGPSRDESWTDPTMVACVDKIRAAQPQRSIEDPLTATPDTPNTWVSVSVVCQAMTLFEAIATKAGDTLNNDTFRAAGNSLGKIDIPGKDGASFFSDTSRSGNPPVFLGRWDSDAEKLVISTTPIR
jgi:hypothetical protein